ncbi:MAG: hypothetical protein H7240_05575 [Glaciimonas sp.]|nr:hypothetical protein [Glaciimonas sp.]
MFELLRRVLFLATAAAIMVLTAAQVRAFDILSVLETASETLQAAFSPWDDIEGLITESISGAKKILVQAY